MEPLPGGRPPAPAHAPPPRPRPAAGASPPALLTWRLVPDLGALQEALLDELLGCADVNLLAEVVRPEQREVVVRVHVVECQNEEGEGPPAAGLGHGPDRRRAEEAPGEDPRWRGGEVELEGIIQRLTELLVKPCKLAREDLCAALDDELPDVDLLQEVMDALQIGELQDLLRGRGRGGDIRLRDGAGDSWTKAERRRRLGERGCAPGGCVWGGSAHHRE